MQCPKCKADNPKGKEFCHNCGAPLREITETVEFTETGDSSVELKTIRIKPGSMLGSRYKITAKLGKGGMGMVYRAWDNELNEEVAIKILKPEFSGSDDIVARFKQEIKLARSLVHKNITQIYDLGEEEGIKFISMKYIEGRDLKDIIAEQGALTQDEGVRIVKQICSALAEAHGKNIVHRDLKPQNIMIDKNGNSYIMDFGIARSTKVAGLTQTGSVIGTPHYMSPEQAKGQKVDDRSDIYSLGIIMYEMFTGNLPFDAESSIQIALKQIKEKAKDPSKIKPDIPEYLEKIILRCMEKNRDLRYQTVEEIIKDLEAKEVKLLPWKKLLIRYKMILLAAAAILIGVSVLLFYTAIKSKAPEGEKQPPPLVVTTAKPSLAVMYFENATGSSELEWMRTGITEMIITDLTQSKYIRILSGERMYQVLKDLDQLDAKKFGIETIKKLRDCTGVEIALMGSYYKIGNKIRLDIRMQIIATEELIHSERVEGIGEESIFSMVDELTRKVKYNLDIPEEKIITDIDKSIADCTTNSVEATIFYNEGINYLRQGNNTESVTYLNKAYEKDPNFAMALAKLAEAYNNLGYDDKAKEFASKATVLMERVSPKEKYFIIANQARITNDYDKAIEAYKKLVEIYPDDAEVYYNLGVAYENKSSFEEAINNYKIAITQDKQFIKPYQGLGNIYFRMSKYKEALSYLTEVLKLCDLRGSLEIKVLTLNRIGGIYLHQGIFDDALKYYQEALTLAENIDFKRAIAGLSSNIGFINESISKYDEALKFYNKALNTFREIGSQVDEAYTLGNISYVNYLLSNYEKSIAAAQESLRISTQINEQQGAAFAHENLGAALISLGRYQEGLDHFQKSLDIAQEMKYPRLVGTLFYEIAELNYRIKDMDKAIQFANQALDYARKYQLPEIEIRANADLSLIKADNKNFQQAISLANKALTEAEEKDMKQLAIRAHLHLAKIFLAQKDTIKAIEETDKGIKKAEPLKAKEYLMQLYYVQAKAKQAANQKARALKDFKSAVDVIEQIKENISKENLDFFVSRYDIQSIYKDLVALLKSMNREKEASQYSSYIKEK